MRVGERGPRGVELLEKAAGDGHVEPVQLAGEGLGHRRSGARRRGRHCPRRSRLRRDRTRWFTRMNLPLDTVRLLRRRREGKSECSDGDSRRRHDGSVRRSLVRLQLCGDRLGLPLREVEELRQDVASILGGEDLRQLDDARQAKAAVAQGLDDLGESLDEVGRGLAVERGALGEAELAVQEVRRARSGLARAIGARGRSPRVRRGSRPSHGARCGAGRRGGP